MKFDIPILEMGASRGRTTVLGNISVGSCSRVAAGSVVLQNVPEKSTVAGVPAKVVGAAGCTNPSISMDQIIKRK